MGKRLKRDNHLDREQIEEGVDSESGSNQLPQKDLGNKEDIDKPEVIQQRKIISVKRRIPPSRQDEKDEQEKQNQQEKKDEPKGFKLSTSLPGTTSGSLFGNMPNNNNGEKKSLFNFFAGTSKDENKDGPKATSSNLFGNGSFKFQKSASGGSGLFGNSTSTGSNLFGAPLKDGATSGGSLFQFKPATGKSLFSANNSLFGDPKTNLFAKKEEDKPDNVVEENSDGGVPAPDEPASLQLQDATAQQSPFDKIFERDIQKYKILQTKTNSKKKSMGNGKLSIQKGQFGSIVIFKVIFKNAIGKILFDGTINHQYSKQRKIEEKAYKNQLKIALIQQQEAEKTSVQHCSVNFQRSTDMEEFQEEFKKAIEELENPAKFKVAEKNKNEEQN